MSGYAVVIAGAGPAGMMLAAELALATVDVALIERRPDHVLVGSRAGGFHSRTIELLDQRGVADRFLAAGQVVQAAIFGSTVLDMSDFPTRHPYSLGLWQNHIERIMAEWIAEMGVPMYYQREVTGFAQDNTGVDIQLADGEVLRAQYLVGCDGGRSAIRKAAGIEFVGWDATRSSLIAEVEVAEEPPRGNRHDAAGIHALHRLEDGKTFRVIVGERQLGPGSEPALADLSKALIAVYGTDFGIHNPSWISRFTDMTRQAAAYRAERHPAGARAIRHTMAQGALQRREERMEALSDLVSELARMDEPRKRIAGTISGLDIHYDLGEGHPLLGRRMPDLDLITAGGPLRFFELLHDARPVLLNLGEPSDVNIAPWADRVKLIHASYHDKWELPVLGPVSSPSAVLVRPDGYVAWVGSGTEKGLREALTTWFGPPATA